MTQRVEGAGQPRTVQLPMRLARCCGVCLVLLAAAFASLVMFYGSLARIDMVLQRRIMRLVRDVGRFKARRRTGAGGALVPVLFGSDDTGRTSSVLRELRDNHDEFDIISLEDLSRARGSSNDEHLWLAVLGHVFDVSAGQRFYAPGKSYHVLTGRDATLALATGDLGGEGRQSPAKTLEQLTPDEMEEANRWLEYFATHDRYQHVGRLPASDDDVVDIDYLVDIAMGSKRASSDNDVPDPSGSDDGGPQRPPAWHPEVEDMDAACPAGGNKRD